MPTIGGVSGNTVFSGNAVFSSNTVFVDTSAWIGLYDRSDQHHARAVEIWRGIQEDRRFLLTNDYVLDETYTLLRRGRGGLAMAEALHALLSSSRILEVRPVDTDLFERAWALFTGYRDQILSFTDCVCFAQMRRHNLIEAFSFDSSFQRAGFVLRS